jgi:hypothetical protein
MLGLLREDNKKAELPITIDGNKQKNKGEYSL